LAQEKPVFVKAFVNFASVKKLRLVIGFTAFPYILQIEQSANSSTTYLNTSSQQTKSLDSTWGQEAFQQKYQPVEVRNSEGEWVRGYFVHKCLAVANLEGIERKYALVDKSEEKYIFWGEIRLPRC
jgi:hypothetical protein